MTASTFIDVLRSVNVGFGAVVAGGMVMEFMLILPMARQIPAADAARAHRIMSPIAWLYIPVCGALTVTSAVVLLIVWHWQTIPASSVGLTIAGLACFVAAVTTNLGFYLRADRAARAWKPEDGDAAFTQLLGRMSTLHVIRMILFLTGFACFVVAAVLG